MDAKRFDKLVDRVFEHCKQTLSGKGDEYARNGDRLWNFKEAGRLEGKSPERALQGMKIKQYVSVRDIVDDVVDRGKQLPPEAYLLEKFGDEINYYLLLLGLLYDRGDETSLLCTDEHIKGATLDARTVDENNGNLCRPLPSRETW